MSETQVLMTVSDFFWVSFWKGALFFDGGAPHGGGISFDEGVSKKVMRWEGAPSAPPPPCPPTMGKPETNVANCFCQKYHHG